MRVEEMSDEGVNVEIAKLLYPNCDIIAEDGYALQFPIASTSGTCSPSSPTASYQMPIPMYDYCNSWTDVMPHVFELGIDAEMLRDGDGIAYCKAEFWYKYDTDCITQENENPTRALAECLLKVLRYKNNVV